MICKICKEEFDFQYGLFQGTDEIVDTCYECQREEFENMARDDHFYPCN